MFILLCTLAELKKNYKKDGAEEEVKIAAMQEQLEWYQKELNLNPLSWGKKRKKRK